MGTLQTNQSAHERKLSMVIQNGPPQILTFFYGW